MVRDAQSGSRDPSLDVLRLLRDEVDKRAQRGADARSSLDTKAAGIAAFAATAVQFLATRNDPPLLLAVAAYTCYALSFGLAVAAYALRKYDDPMQPKLFVDRYARESEEQVLLTLISNAAKSVQDNEEKQERRAKLWWVSVAALAVGIVLAVGVIVQTR